MGIYEALEALHQSDFYPYHMPGHKRAMAGQPLQSAYDIDITEIDGFDNLSQPVGILKEAQERVARLYGAKASFYLVNGSTGGILGAIAACTTFGDKVLVARNCHKSVYNAIAINGLHPIYLMPEAFSPYDMFGPISPKNVEEILSADAQIRAVILTSPTYEGIISDIKAIAQAAHKRGIPLIVDSAHGAHLGLSCDDSESVSAIACGADFVIQSAHKTLPAMTQTAVLHYHSALIPMERIQESLLLYQTTSPSYVLMAALDLCYKKMECEGTVLFGNFNRRMSNFRKRMSKLHGLQVLSAEDFSKLCPNTPFWYDEGKIIISGARIGMTGSEIYDILYRHYHLQLEMSMGSYALAMMTVMDGDEGFDRLAEALEQMDSELKSNAQGVAQSQLHMSNIMDLYREPEVCMSPFEANLAKRNMQGASVRQVPISEAGGCISAEFVCLYPPGIPLVVPGERIAGVICQELPALNGMKEVAIIEE